MTPFEYGFSKRAFELKDLIPTDFPEDKAWTQNASGTGFQYDQPQQAPVQPSMQQSPIQAAPPLGLAQSPIQAPPSPAPMPVAPPQAVKFQMPKEPSAPVLKEPSAPATPFKAPQISTGMGKQAAFNLGFQKRAGEYVNKIAFVPQDTDFGSGFVSVNHDNDKTWLTANDPDGWNNFRNNWEQHLPPSSQAGSAVSARIDDMLMPPKGGYQKGTSDAITDILHGALRTKAAVPNVAGYGAPGPIAGVFGPKSAIKFGK